MFSFFGIVFLPYDMFKMNKNKGDKMVKDCQFLKDLNDNTSHGLNRGHYNLICSKRDLMLFTKGIKPHRQWRLKDVKTYFGIKGNAESVLSQLIKINEIINNKQRGIK
tara:strand:+ start:1197 stop:1520 length:324 start_codon:yes stop_codon:yes gene_type:complete